MWLMGFYLGLCLAALAGTWWLARLTKRECATWKGYLDEAMRLDAEVRAIQADLCRGLTCAKCGATGVALSGEGTGPGGGGGSGGVVVLSARITANGGGE